MSVVPLRGTPTTKMASGSPAARAGGPLDTAARSDGAATAAWRPGDTVMRIGVWPGASAGQRSTVASLDCTRNRTLVAACPGRPGGRREQPAPGPAARIVGAVIHTQRESRGGGAALIALACPTSSADGGVRPATRRRSPRPRRCRLLQVLGGRHVGRTHPPAMGGDRPGARPARRAGAGQLAMR
jgi:hypothetical protein